MKKSLVLAILVLAAGATASYAQGTVSFLNYFSSTSPTVKYAASDVPAGKAGLALGGSFAAELYYFNGIAGSTSQLSPVLSSLTYFSINGPAANSTADGDASNGAGYFFGPVLGLTGTSSGEVVSLDVFAFNNGSLAGATVAGSSGLFTVTLGGGVLPPASLNGTPGASFTVANNVPEPATMALGGLGMAALMLFRRKQV